MRRTRRRSGCPRSSAKCGRLHDLAVQDGGEQRPRISASSAVIILPLDGACRPRSLLPAVDCVPARCHSGAVASLSTTPRPWRPAPAREHDPAARADHDAEFALVVEPPASAVLTRSGYGPKHAVPARTNGSGQAGTAWPPSIGRARRSPRPGTGSAPGQDLGPASACPYSRPSRPADGPTASMLSCPASRKRGELGVLLVPRLRGNVYVPGSAAYVAAAARPAWIWSRASPGPPLVPYAPIGRNLRDDWLNHQIGWRLDRSLMAVNTSKVQK